MFHTHSTKCLLSHSLLPSPFNLSSIFPSPGIVFISQSARVFPCMSLTFPFPPPRGACSHSSQISASGETLQLLQMLKCWSHPLLAPDYHHSRFAAHPCWFAVQQAAVSVHWKGLAVQTTLQWSLWGPCKEQPITALNPCWCVKPIRSRDPVA